MPEAKSLSSYDYAYIRVVPRVERDEFVNVGVILFCRTQRFLGAALCLDVDRLRMLYPKLDVESVRQQLDIIIATCNGDGPIAALGKADAFHWLVAPHSTVIQTSPVHSGLCHDPQSALAHLIETM